MNAVAKFDTKLAAFKSAEEKLLSDGFAHGWLSFAKHLVFSQVGIRFDRCKAAANFLMGTESVDLEQNNIVSVDLDSVVIDGFVIEHKQLFFYEYWHHYFKVTKTV